MNININEIRIHGNGMVQRNAGQKSPILDIGKKGQMVEGTITKVGNGVTLNFQGIEVSVSKDVVKSPVEGQIRKFEIMEVSSESIVLKEIDTSRMTEEVRSMVSTTADTSEYTFAECLANSKDTKEAKDMAKETLSIISGEDYEAIEKEEGSLAKKTKECIERAVEQKKEYREWTAKRQEEGMAHRQAVQENREQMEAEGFLSQKTESQIRMALEEAGIPATEEVISQITTALEMSQSAQAMSDATKAFLLGQQLAPTIENIYQGTYCGVEKKVHTDVEKEFAQYEKQIKSILDACGKNTKQDMEAAKWLFANELPVNEEMLEKYQTLSTIASTITERQALEQIVYAISVGISPKDANLDTSQIVMAKDAIVAFSEISDSTIVVKAEHLMIRNTSVEEAMSEVTLSLLKQSSLQENAQNAQTYIPKNYTLDMSEEEILAVTMKRQLEEIRQKMTVQSAVTMAQKGIRLELDSLEQIIESLRDIENTYHCKQAGMTPETMPTAQMQLFHETLTKTEEIAKGHAGVLGGAVRQQQLLTMNELHAAITSETANRREWNDVYETVQTQVRKDLGDSIKDAFASIPGILDDLEMENTEANQRAVRILGYNSIEITKENVEQVKYLDAKVNQVIENMKPSTVLECIRRGINPLDIPLDELNSQLEEINAEKAVSDEERYSRFLWQMEKNGKISKEERAGYIGVYRLLTQIEKTDGAVIGAVMESNRELTLGNLLTQVRTRKGKGIDSIIDETTGFSDGPQIKGSITDQIAEGFSVNAEKQNYYENLVHKAVSEVTPEKLQRMTDSDLERLLGVSLEKFVEDLKQIPDADNVKKEYYQMLAQQMRDSLNDSQEAEQFLEKVGLPNTAENIMAVQNVLNDSYSVFKEVEKRKNVLSKQRQEELEEIETEIAECIDEPERLDEKCEAAEKILQEVLTKSYNQSDITLESLDSLKQLGQGIRLQGFMRRQQSYDIPIRTGEGITSLNLTIIHGAKESGRIQISMEDEVFGTISMDFNVADSSVKGLVLCDQRQGFELLQENGQALKQCVESTGYQVKNISYGMESRTRNERLNEKMSKEQTDTRDLYRIAKELVRFVKTVL